MMITYDAEADALYVQLNDALVCRSQHVDAGTLVDVDEHGTIVGIEVLQPARDWPLEEVIETFAPPADAVAMLNAIFNPDKPSGLRPFVPHRQLATA